jgi:hypothetical protein
MHIFSFAGIYIHAHIPFRKLCLFCVLQQIVAKRLYLNTKCQQIAGKTRAIPYRLKSVCVFNKQSESFWEDIRVKSRTFALEIKQSLRLRLSENRAMLAAALSSVSSLE